MKGERTFIFGKNIKDETDRIRANRGKDYALRGAVWKVMVDPGKVTAEVIGSKLYKVSLYGNTLSEENKRKVINIINEKSYLSSLLSNWLPNSLIDDLWKEGIKLIPEKLSYTCTCLDLQRPCKHIYAVYIVINKMISDNPLLLFKFLGINREDLIYGMKRRAKSEVSVRDFQVKYEFPKITPINVKPWHNFGIDKKTVKEVYTLIMKTAKEKMNELK